MAPTAVDPATAGQSASIRICNYHGVRTLPKGAVLRLFPRPAALPVVGGRPVPLCVKCGAVASPLCGRNAQDGYWACSFCRFQNAGYFSATDLALGTFPELVASEVEFQQPLPASKGPSSLWQGGATSAPPGLVLVLDRTMESKEEACALVEALVRVLEREAAVRPMTPVSLVVFGHAISIYRVGLFGGAGAVPLGISVQVVDGSSTPLPPEQERLVGEGFETGQYSVPLHAGKEQLAFTLRDLVASETFRYNARPESGVARCLACAVSCLTRGYPGPARVLVFTTGPASDGCDEPGAPGPAGSEPHRAARRQEQFRQLSAEARRKGLLLDVFCLGLASTFDCPSLHALVGRSGGSVWLRPSAADPELEEDLLRLLQSANPSSAAIPHGVEVEVRVSEHMTVVSTLGKAAGDSDEAGDGGEAAWRGDEAALEHSWSLLHEREQRLGAPVRTRRHPPSLPKGCCSRLRLDGVREDLALDVGVLLANRDSVFGTVGLQRPDVYVVQFVARHLSSDGRCLVTRVATQAVNTKVTPFDHSVLPVLVAKRAVRLVLASQPGGPYGLDGARAVVDEVVREAVRSFPSGQTYRRTQAGTGKPYLWELAGALEALFQARRGPLLGHLPQVLSKELGLVAAMHCTGGQNEDARYCLWVRFMEAPLEDALRLMAPALYCPTRAVEARRSTAVPPPRETGHSTEGPSGVGESLREWPCESMALWPSLVLLLDTHERLCIWKGTEAAAKLDGRMPCEAGEREGLMQDLQACRAEAARRRAGRLPTPPVLEVQADQPLARFVLSRVMASHKEAEEDLLPRFHELRLLGQEEAEAMRLSLGGVFGDDPSFAQYLRSQGGAPTKLWG